MRFLATRGWCSVASKRSYKIRLELANLRASSSISDSVTDPSHCLSPMITADILDLAYQWLCQQRRDAHHNHDIWHLRWNWNGVRTKLLGQLAAGTYRLSPTRMVTIDGDCFEVWSSRDSLVLKAVSIVLSRQWNGLLSHRCFHLVGRGGAKAALREVMNQMHHTDDHAQANDREINGSQTITTSRPARAASNVNFITKFPPPSFVFKSDVKSYYASMNHDILIGQLTQLIDDPLLLDLVCQYVRRTVVTDGIYTDVQQGIPLGCSLSPLMAAVYLKPLDEAMEKTGLFYARFMDDWVVLAPTRWKLRKVVRITNRVLHRLRVDKHPDKTFVGRVVRGLEFLGYHLKPSLQTEKADAQATAEDATALPTNISPQVDTTQPVGMTVQLRMAKKTRQRFVSRVTRLYEQGSIHQKMIEGYVRRWKQWATGGLGEFAKQLILDDDVDGYLQSLRCRVSPSR